MEEACVFFVDDYEYSKHVSEASRFVVKGSLKDWFREWGDVGWVVLDSFFNHEDLTILFSLWIK